MQILQPAVRDPLSSPIHKHLFLRRFVIIAIVCIAVFAYRAAQLGTNPSEIHVSPSSLTTSTIYQEAVDRCQRLMMIDHRRHWCGELAYEPSFFDPPTVLVALRRGVDEFADPAHGVSTSLTGAIDWPWNYQSGLWGGHAIAHWWQSALALRSLMRYLELTRNADPRFQTILMRTYERERGLSQPPFAIAKQNFVNDFGDDTAWWGLAWLEASKYELNVRHDIADARNFLGLAAYDADYIAARPKMCGGVEWKIGNAPDTITGAEYTALAAGLAEYASASGPFHDPAKASRWLAQARQTLAWLEEKRLIDPHSGEVRNGLQDGTCDRTSGGPLTYTEGQVAQALVGLGSALRNPLYYRQADAFLKYALSSRSGFVNGQTGILQEACERGRTACTGDPQYLDVLSWKGILMQALQDYRLASGSTEHDAFILRQARAIVHNSIRQPNGQPGVCDTAQNCQFVFYWGWPLSPVRSPFVNDATQMDAIDALTAALAVNPAA